MGQPSADFDRLSADGGHGIFDFRKFGKLSSRFAMIPNHRQGGLMAKRTKSARTERNEDLKRVLNRLLALLSGRGGEPDWESLMLRG